MPPAPPSPQQEYVLARAVAFSVVVIWTYEKEGSNIAARWQVSNKANKKAEKAKSKEDDNSSDIR